MPTIDKLRRMYEEELAKGPFPTDECGVAHIDGKMHGDLIMYLANMAGLASRGIDGLTSLSESEKGAFLGFADRDLFERCPVLQERITLVSTPKLYALLRSTEQARQLIIQALSC
jgi:hypothetical protein